MVSSRYEKLYNKKIINKKRCCIYLQHLFFISAIIKNSKNTQANIIYLLITKSPIINEAQNNVIINRKLLAIAINFSKDNFFNIMKITSFLNLQKSKYSLFKK